MFTDFNSQAVSEPANPDRGPRAEIKISGGI